RRGLALPRARHPDETDDPHRRPGGDAQRRPRHQHRGPRRLQPAPRRLLPRGRPRQMADPRSARHGGEDIGEDLGEIDMAQRKRRHSRSRDEDARKFEALRVALKEGVDALDRGDYVEIDEVELTQYLEELRLIPDSGDQFGMTDLGHQWK